MYLALTKVDLHCKINNSAHRTQFISEQRLIVRRGQSFLLTLDLPGRFQTDQDTLLITAETGPKASEASGTRAVFGFLNGQQEKAAWRAEVDQRSVLLAGSVTLAVTPSANAPVGEYILSVKTSADAIQQTRLGSLVLLFNPWCEDDWVYLSEEEEREEYVMKEQGIIFRGTDRYISTIGWDYGQFEEDIVGICLKMLDINPKYLRGAAKDVSARCNPIYVSRVVSAMINSNDDRGVLQGNWGSSFYGGVSPTHWNGSVEILRRWIRYGCHPVKYGQCWVFAGVMCTVLRCLGVPCRVVTNFQSAHDTDKSLTIDEFYGDYGVQPKDSKDSVWNYHVWVEAWMRRPDLSADRLYDGWQVLDPTPQEKSTGVFCCGPCPVKAILQGRTDLRYDLPFVFAEVNADRVTWLVAADGSKRRIYSDTSSVGQNISTKSVGSDKRLNITDSYKHREGTTEERTVYTDAVTRGKYPMKEDWDTPDGADNGTPNGTDNGTDHGTPNGTDNGTREPGRVEMTLAVDGKPRNGTDIRLSLVLHNQANAPCRLLLHVNVQAMRYTGTLASQVQTEEKEQQLRPGQEVTIPILIPFSAYGKHMLENDSIKVSAVATDQENPEDVYLTEMDVVPESPTLTITALGPAQQYQELTVEVVFTNPLSEALRDCSITVTGSGLLSNSAGDRLALLPPGSRARMQMTLVPYRPGAKKLVADFDCSAFRDIKASCNVDVAPYNWNIGRTA